MVEFAYVIQRNDGLFAYWDLNNNIIFAPQIDISSLFRIKPLCEQLIRNLNLKDCKPIKVQIKVVEE